MLQIAGASFSFGELTLEESAVVLRELGFGLTDVGAGWDNYHQIRPQEAVDHPDEQAERLRRVMDENCLGVSELFVISLSTTPTRLSVSGRRRCSGPLRPSHKRRALRV